jgi:uncharacterized protein YxeA
MKKSFILLLISAMPFALLAQAPKKGPLDKKTYTIEITKDGKKKPMDPDELKFEAGKVKCKSFVDWGFTKPGEYTITSVDSSDASAKVYSWSATTVNDIKENMNWEGTITGEDIEGTAALVTAKGDTKYSYTFTGKLKGKPGKK